MYSEHFIDPDAVPRSYEDEYADGVTTKPPELTLADCLNHDESCAGAVEYRMPLSGTGRAFPRCDHHWEERLAEQERINARYPTHAPADFDPLYAGERWDEDDPSW